MAIAGAAFVLIGISVWAVRRVNSAPHLLTGWLWYLGMLVPVAGLVQVGGQSMADRYTYVPLIGVFIAVVWSIRLRRATVTRRPQPWPSQFSRFVARCRRRKFVTGKTAKLSTAMP